MNTHRRKTHGMIPFSKYEGTANDFVIVEHPHAADLEKSVVAEMCDRHRGIGADGVIVISPTPEKRDTFRMIIRNADGSRPEMCGNGARCVAWHLVRTNQAQSPVMLLSDAGPRTCVVTTQTKSAKPIGAVTINMGRIVLENERTIRTSFGELLVTKANAGNPHAITFDEVRDELIDLIGKELQNSNEFPDGVNFECVHVEPHALRITVFERGVGRTFACGTGACAVATVYANKHNVFDCEIETRLEGGSLFIQVSRLNEVTMRGPARWVFDGTWAGNSPFNQSEQR